MSSKFKVIQYGCGVIGCHIVRLASTKSSIDIVGAVDLLNVGRDLGEVAGLGRSLGVRVCRSLQECLTHEKPDVVLHATGSDLRRVYPEMESLMKAGLNVVSTSEALSYPFRKEPELSAKIDRLSKEHKVSILGTGINPGFVMDTWPLMMTAVCQEVKTIKVVRIQNASLRRASFQKKIGAGSKINEFNELVAKGNFGHVGLAESIAMISAGLSWKLDNIKETLEPIIADEDVESDVCNAKRGEVAGIRQMAYGIREGQEVITLDFQARIGSKTAYDAVYITGTPDLKVVIEGGVPGDIATASMVVNAIPRVINAPPGLLAMKDLPPVCTIPS